MPPSHDLDPIDAAILELLQESGRLPQVEVARAVGLTPPAVLERLRKLEARGVIRGYAAVIDPAALDRRLLAFIAVRSDGLPGDDAMGHELARIDEVLEVHHIAGDDCFLLKVRARDTDHLSSILRDKIGRIPGVRSTRTTIVLGSLKETARLPVSRSLAAVEGS